MTPPADRAKRQDKIVNPEDAKWRPTSNDPVLVSFDSQPSGARVEMDGATLCATTPCKKMVEPGLRAFRMSADKFVTREERVRVDGDEQKVSWKLEANTAVVTVDTGSVSGVPIVVDGEAAGKSPLRLDLGAGPHRIEIKDPCYEPARADVSVERGVAKRVALNGVPKTAGLRVELSDAKDEPVQGDVRLDGVMVGRTWKTLTVPACGSELEVVAKEGGVTQSVRLRAQDTTKLAIRLDGGSNRAPSAPQPPSVGDAPLSEKDIALVLSQRKIQLRRACWENIDNHEANVRVLATVRIETTGYVGSVDATGTDTAVTNCIRRQLREWRFPTAGAPTTATLPFSFVSQ
jgi:hypothetical protein